MYQSYLHLLFLVFIAIARANDTNTSEYRADYTYIEPARGWLKLHHMPATFVEAFLHCKLEGAVLASPLNEELQTAMGIMQEKSKMNRAIFTGIHATISKTDLTSIEGIPLSMIPVTWAPSDNFSDNFEAECIIMLLSGSVTFARCTDKYPYVCYKEKTTNTVITECGTVDTGYKRDPYTGSCYKFHRHAVSWRRAQMTCLAEGGHLAIINNLYEVDIIKDLFGKNPENTIKGSEYPTIASIGYLDWNKKGAWYTVNGQSLEEAGYSKWNIGSPNNAIDNDGVGQYCGGMENSGNFEDVWCDSYLYPFICEITLNSSWIEKMTH